MNLDYEIDFDMKLVYVLTDGVKRKDHRLGWSYLEPLKNDQGEWLYQGRGQIYSIARDYLIDYGYIKE